MYNFLLNNPILLRMLLPSDQVISFFVVYLIEIMQYADILQYVHLMVFITTRGRNNPPTFTKKGCVQLIVIQIYL